MLELNKIYNEDCLKTMKRFEIGKNGFNGFDLIIADPPYYDVVNEKWDKQWNNENEYLDWCELWLKEFKRLLKPNGSVYIWGIFPTIHSIVHIAKKYFEPLQENIWYKPNGNPIGGKCKFRQLFENCISFVNDKKNYIFNADDVREPYKDDYETILKKRNKKDIERGYIPDPRGKLRSNVWIYGNQRKQGHFTPKHE
ncbi:Modification methylase RsrI [[Flavobacterium] thermophilum]|nr:Modification methylase RsrI [[Flavobacterium] thermophilum]